MVRPPRLCGLRGMNEARMIGKEVARVLLHLDRHGRVVVAASVPLHDVLDLPLTHGEALVVEIGDSGLDRDACPVQRRDEHAVEDSGDRAADHAE